MCKNGGCWEMAALHASASAAADVPSCGCTQQEDVLAASALYDGYCQGDLIRFQILRGRLWVDFRTDRTDLGWFPMKLGVGGLSPGPGAIRLPA